MVMSGTITTASIGGRRVFRIHQVAPFLASYQIGTGPTRWTLRPRKAQRLANAALGAAIREAEGK